MTTRAHRILRGLHAAAIVAIGITLAGILRDNIRLALAAVVPVLGIIVISLEALRAATRNQEPR